MNAYGEAVQVACALNTYTVRRPFWKLLTRSCLLHGLYKTLALWWKNVLCAHIILCVLKCRQHVYVRNTRYICTRPHGVTRKRHSVTIWSIRQSYTRKEEEFWTRVNLWQLDAFSSLRNVKFSHWWRHISYVLQEVTLEQNFLRFFRFFRVNLFSTMLHIYVQSLNVRHVLISWCLGW
jgi:hypothetical protein